MCRILFLATAACVGMVPIVTGAQEGAEEAVAEIEEIIVTGSRIKRRNLISTSPVAQVEAVELDLQGITRVEDLLNDLPQTVADQSSAVNNGSVGTATVDLRGLAAVRTLTLLNGRRLPAGTPTNPAADINQIPGMLIERVEILTGGASATYGSDALSGVVNFITLSDFEGFEVDYQFSQYAHTNDSPLAELVTDAGYELPARNVRDGNTHNLSLMYGVNLPGGRGNVTAYAGYREVEAVTQSERDHSACAINQRGAFCSGSSTIPDGRFTDFGFLSSPPCAMVPNPTPEDPNAMACNRVPEFDPATGMPTGGVDDDGNPILVNEPVEPWFGNMNNGTTTWPGRYDFLVESGTNEFVNRRGHPNAWYNFAPTNFFMRPDERITAGAFGYFGLNDAAEIYFELNHMDDKSVAQLAPSGSFFWPDSVSCSNPLLSQQQVDMLCTRYGLTAADTQIAYIGRRNAEGGSRRSETQHTQYRGVLGVRGDLGDTWSYDAFVNYGKVDHSELFDEDLSVTRMIRAIDVVSDPASGSPVCRTALDGSDPNCVPWNVFQSGAVTQEALDYITQPLYFDGSTRQFQTSAYISGDLGDYGIQVPSADEGIKVVVGAEYRDERIDYEPDPAASSGDVAGFGQTVTAISGSYSVAEIYAEASVPLLQGVTAAEQVLVDVAYRYSDYSTDKSTNTYKIAGEWMFVEGFRLRASFQHAVRVGNINELFRPLQQGSGNGPDTCEGQNPSSTLEECQRTGLTAAQYGTVPLSDDFGFITRFGGNPELDPEESDTVSFGFVVNPQFLPGFTLSVDWFDIDVEGAIAEPDSKFIFDRCIETGEPRFCNSINRDPATGLLWLGDGYVDTRNTNIGALRTSGVDFIADYIQPIGRAGDLQFNLVGTYVDSWEWQELPGETPYECVGKYEFGPCTRPRPELTTNFRTTWLTPWDASISLLWRHISDLVDGSEFDYDVPSTDYFDIAGTWDLTDSINLRFGVNNLLDEDPPLAPCCAGNTMPRFYEALGRYWFAGVRFRL